MGQRRAGHPHHRRRALPAAAGALRDHRLGHGGRVPHGRTPAAGAGAAQVHHCGGGGGDPTGDSHVPELLRILHRPDQQAAAADGRGGAWQSGRGVRCRALHRRDSPAGRQLQQHDGQHPRPAEPGVPGAAGETRGRDPHPAGADQAPLPLQHPGHHPLDGGGAPGRRDRAAGERADPPVPHQPEPGPGDHLPRGRDGSRAQLPLHPEGSLRGQAELRNRRAGGAACAAGEQADPAAAGGERHLPRHQAEARRGAHPGAGAAGGGQTHPAGGGRRCGHDPGEVRSAQRRAESPGGHGVRPRLRHLQRQRPHPPVLRQGLRPAVRDQCKRRHYGNSDLSGGVPGGRGRSGGGTRRYGRWSAGRS